MAKTYFKNGLRLDVIKQTLTPVSVAAATSAEQTFTVNGLLATDFVVVNWSGSTTAVGLTGFRVSAADTLALTFTNATAGALVPTAGEYEILVFASV